MKVVLCNDGVCVPPKCPVVDVRSDKVIIGEKTERVHVNTRTVRYFKTENNKRRDLNKSLFFFFFLFSLVSGEDILLYFGCTSQCFLP